LKVKDKLKAANKKLMDLLHKKMKTNIENIPRVMP
jgi:hypothetical protein